MADVALSGAAAAGPHGAWYKRSPEDVAERLDVDPAVGLSSGRAAELLAQHGPNALPVEEAIAGWRWFLQQYRSYMQIILITAAIVSLAVKEWGTGVLLVLITRRARGAPGARGKPSGKHVVITNDLPIRRA